MFKKAGKPRRTPRAQRLLREICQGKMERIPSGKETGLAWELRVK
jgi:hypothetical protein